MGAKVSSLWGILSPLIRSQGPPMADVSFTTGPSSSLFWQGGALCRLHCTNTKLFVQRRREREKKSLSPLPPSFLLFIYSTAALHVSGFGLIRAITTQRPDPCRRGQWVQDTVRFYAALCKIHLTSVLEQCCVTPSSE